MPHFGKFSLLFADVVRYNIGTQLVRAIVEKILSEVLYEKPVKKSTLHRSCVAN